MAPAVTKQVQASEILDTLLEQAELKRAGTAVVAVTVLAVNVLQKAEAEATFETKALAHA